MHIIELTDDNDGIIGLSRRDHTKNNEVSLFATDNTTNKTQEKMKNFHSENIINSFKSIRGRKICGSCAF